METRTCPYCKQEIPADSRKCHYCREWVDRRFLVKRTVKWAVPLAIVWMAIAFLPMSFMDQTVLRGRKFWQQPDAITIIRHHAGQGEKGGIYVIGTMKNVSTTPWDSVAVQVDYFDPKGQLVDTSQDWSSETIAPGQERSFKVVFEKKQKGVEYDHYRIFVAGAGDASRF
jgi:hypothetical protein